MNNEELNQKFAVFEQQIRQIQEQLGAVEQAIVDLTSINTGLEDLKGKKDEEIMAPIGRGIFVKAKLLSEDLTVDVGGKNFVNKSIPETKELIEDQVGKLNEMKEALDKELEKINNELTSTMINAQGGHPCGENCGCDSEHEQCREEGCNCSQ